MNLARSGDPAVSGPAGSRAPDVGRRDLTSLLRMLSAVGVAAVVILAQAGLVLAPSQLGRHPLLVLALRPTPAFLVLLGDLVAPATAILMASVSRTLVDMAYFAVARHGALPIAERFGAGRNLADKVSQRAASRGLLTVSFFWSSTPVVAALGLGRTPTLKFLVVTGAGNLVTSAAFAASGHQFSRYIAPVTMWVSAHGAQLTIAVGFGVAVSGLMALRRARRPVA